MDLWRLLNYFQKMLPFHFFFLSFFSQFGLSIRNNLP